MLKIGEFSRLSQVTVKTLHHYDQIGLLKPAHTDKFTDYRYYMLDQLPRIHSIMALKELGLSLEEIIDVLQHDLSPDEIRGMLKLKQAQAQQRLREEQARISQIEFRLRQIEEKGKLDTVDIVIKRIEPFHAMILRGGGYLSESEQLQAELDLEEAVKSGQLRWNGNAITTIYYEKEFQGDYSDGEVCLPVDLPHPPSFTHPRWGTLILRELPAIEAAATYLHQGDYDTLNEKYLFLQRWAVENGYKLSGTWRFVYHRGPMHHVDPSENITELQHPIEPALAGT